VKNVCKETVPTGIMGALLSVANHYNTLPLISLSLCVNDWMLSKVVTRKNHDNIEATRLRRAQSSRSLRVMRLQLLALLIRRQNKEAKAGAFAYAAWRILLTQPRIAHKSVRFVSDAG
jgi:hypothetical protein